MTLEWLEWVSIGSAGDIEVTYIARDGDTTFALEPYDEDLPGFRLKVWKGSEVVSDHGHFETVQEAMDEVQAQKWAYEASMEP